VNLAPILPHSRSNDTALHRIIIMLTKFLGRSERVRCRPLGEKGSQRDNAGPKVGEVIVVYSGSAGGLSSRSSRVFGALNQFYVLKYILLRVFSHESF
jgi:hypothetical protein